MNRFAGHVLILSGPPRSGKTRTAEQLAQLPGEYVIGSAGLDREATR